jgi:hypothetical protein
VKILTHLEWRKGAPPKGEQTTPVLVIGQPRGGKNPFDAAEDNRPCLFLAHYTDQRLVPAYIRGMSNDEPRPTIDPLFWAKIRLPAGVELASLGMDDFKG